MTKKKGRIMWVPAVVLEELDVIKHIDNSSRHVDAWQRMREHSIIGREAEHIGVQLGLARRKRKK